MYIRGIHKWKECLNFLMYNTDKQVAAKYQLKTTLFPCNLLIYIYILENFYEFGAYIKTIEKRT